jgi:hypothetical protein
MYVIYNEGTGRPFMITPNVADRDLNLGSGVAWLETNEDNLFFKKVVDGVLVDDIDVIAREKGNEARNLRETLLKETDWWAMSDRTMTSEQAAYRQALRDITTHANWPNLADSDWPTKPE